MPEDLNLDGFPIVPEASRPRTIYFNFAVTNLSEAALRGRGYNPVYLLTLPRRTEQEHADFLLAHLQGIEEGTIFSSKEERLRIELSLKAYGMLDKKRPSVNINLEATTEDIKELFNWNSSRHTLRDNTTIVGVSKLQLHQSSEVALEDKRREVLKKLQAHREDKEGIKDAKVLRRKSKQRDKTPSRSDVQRNKRG